MDSFNKVFFNFFMFFFLFAIENGNSQQLYCLKGESAHINNQIWATRNLDIGVFQNGDTILHAPSLEEWLRAGEKGIPAWCYYNNNPILGKEAGRLYNWYAASDERGLAPKGWKIPTSADVGKLLEFIGIDTYTSSRLANKEWENFGATDSYGFSAKPYGARFTIYPPALYPDTIMFYPRTKFTSLGSGVGYWLSDSFKYDNLYGSAFLLNMQAEANIYGALKEDGFYIRCIKEE